MRRNIWVWMTSPMPLQVGQVTGSWPGSAPEPSHTSHTTARGISISRVVPWMASRKSSSIRYSRSEPGRAMRPPRPRPPPPAPPKPKMSPNRSEKWLKISSAFWKLGLWPAPRSPACPKRS